MKRLKSVLFLTVLSVTSIAPLALTLTSMGKSAATAQAEEVKLRKKYPLPRSDRDAKLDPKLLDVTPLKPDPQTTSGRSSKTSKVVSYDVKTRRAKVSLTTPRTGVQRNAVFPGEAGSVPGQDTEPKGGSRTVIGSDDRIKITNTSNFPWRTMTKLYMRFPNGSLGGCSGTMISANHVLTAGHCVYSASRGGWATRVEVIPGLNGTYKPFGSAFATRMRSYTGWTNSASPNWDFALIRLDRSIGNVTGWLGYANYATVNGLTGNMGGYPGELDGGRGLYYSFGSIINSTAQRFAYTFDTSAGQSGSGVYRINSGNRFVMGVHTNGFGPGQPQQNSATRIDGQKFNDLTNWISNL